MTRESRPRHASGRVIWTTAEIVSRTVSSRVNRGKSQMVVLMNSPGRAVLPSASNRRRPAALRAARGRVSLRLWLSRVTHPSSLVGLERCAVCILHGGISSRPERQSATDAVQEIPSVNEGMEVHKMALPGFTADAAVYLSHHQYSASMAGSGASVIVPALPSCKTCDWACKKCLKCLDSGKHPSQCITCRVCEHCGHCP